MYTRFDTKCENIQIDLIVNETDQLSSYITNIADDPISSLAIALYNTALTVHPKIR